MAIATDTDMVICLAPELEGQETRIAKFIEFAKLSVSESVWGDKADLGTGYLTAHMMTVSAKVGIGGEVIREKIGDAEVAYGANKDSKEGELSTTSYGKEFLRLRRSLVISPLITGC